MTEKKKMSRIEAIKEYFNPPQVTSSELIALKKAGASSFEWVGDACLSELDAELPEQYHKE